MNSAELDTTAETDHRVSVVVPVYRGELHLPDLIGELAPLTVSTPTPDGNAFRVVEVILVHDGGPDQSDRVIRELAAAHDWVRPLWLTRNFGQHPATIAGMASSHGEWIATLDEDGQHNPADIAALLDAAISQQAALVYADPVNAAPHSAFRRMSSHLAKRLVNVVIGGADASVFHSFRLVLGEVGRSIAAYAGQGVYLDVALSWVAGPPATAPVTLREEGDRRSGYRVRTLLSHFWRMVLTGGTRVLRLVSLLGMIVALLGLVLAVILVVNRLTGGGNVQGWTSLMVVILLSAGAVLFALGVIAEYVGVAVSMALGRPLYVIGSDPATGPLGRLGSHGR